MKSKIVFPLIFIIFGFNTPSFAQMEDFRNCINSMNQQTFYAPLREKVSLGIVNDQTFSMLTNQSYVSNDEKPVIMAWVNERNRCFSENSTAISNEFSPPVFSLIATLQQNFERVAAQLYTGKITFGEFSQQRAQDASAVGAKIQNLLQAEADNKNQIAAGNEQARRAAILQLMANRPQPYQVKPYIPSPTTTTNCTQFGNQVNCTSR